jgi:transposase InsO family protein
VADDEAALTADITELARQYGRYGYRKVTALLRAQGWRCNHKRVERIWRREGLKVPAQQPKRGRLWLNDGSCVRLRPARVNHVWAYDFVEDRTRDGRKLRMLNVVDEFSREGLCDPGGAEAQGGGRDRRAGRPVHPARHPGLHPVRQWARVRRQSCAEAWITGGGAKTAFIEPGSPWENGCVESFNAKLRDELLNAEVFHTLAEARVLIEQWRQHYNTQRPHAALGYRPPAPEVLLPMLPWRDRGSGPTGSSQGGIILAH